MNRSRISLQPPRWDAQISPFWMNATRPFRKLIDRHLGVAGVETEGLERVRELIAGGAGVMINPNHSSHIDAVVLYRVADQLGHPFYFMTAWQVFEQASWRWAWLFQRLGCFSVGREGNDCWAFKRASGILEYEKYPLVVFPEGEVYHLNERITPLREGVSAIALTAAKHARRPIYMVPTAIRYTYVEDPTPTLELSMDELEEWLHWQPRRHEPLAGRIVRCAEAVLGLKEVEWFGHSRGGPLAGRVNALLEFILGGIEQELELKSKRGDVPERIKEARRALLERIEAAAPGSPDAAHLERRLEDVFLVIQLFSYPGDYIHERPAIERLAETIDKFEEDVLGLATARYHGPRQARVMFGEPIDVAAFAAANESRRGALADLTRLLESRMQQMLDATFKPGPEPQPATDSA